MQTHGKKPVEVYLICLDNKKVAAFLRYAA
jgi:hypothetical protein